MKTNEFVFTGIIYTEGKSFSALCPELDVASEGTTPEGASENLLEAATLYLETAIEANLPYLRPVPPAEDPRSINAGAINRIFNFKVGFQITAHA